MANNDSAVQVMTGPSASWVHHAAAWAQGAFDISAVAALGVVWGAVFLGLAAVVGTTVAVVDDRPPQ